jgi:hypothetical protein
MLIQLQSGSSLLGVVFFDELVLGVSSLGLDGFSGVFVVVGWAASVVSAATAMPMLRCSMAAIAQAKLDNFFILSPRLFSEVVYSVTDQVSDFEVCL